MIRPIPLLTIGIILVAAVAEVSGQDSRSASIIANLPAAARLYIDGNPTQQTGSTRTFVTPPLDPSRDYTYELRADVDRDGELLTRTEPVHVRAGENSRVDFGTLGDDAENSSAVDLLSATDTWPRKLTTDDYTVTVYQPQVEKWDGNRLQARAAVAVQTNDSSRPTYGVVWLTARTQVDKEHRLVTLEALEVTRADFPSAPEKAEEYA